LGENQGLLNDIFIFWLEIKEATKTGCDGEHLHCLTSSLPGCCAFLFKVWVGPVSAASQTVNWQFDSIAVLYNQRTWVLSMT